MSLYELFKDKTNKLENQIIDNIKDLLKDIKGHKVDLTDTFIRRKILVVWELCWMDSVILDEQEVVICFKSVEDDKEIKGTTNHLYLEELLKVLKVVEEEYKNQN